MKRVPVFSHFDQSRLSLGLLTLGLCSIGLFSRAQSYEEQAVAAVLMGEAWSEGTNGMTAVAEVIHQRAKDKGWTPLRVVTSHRGRVHAFSCLNGTTMDLLITRFKTQPDFKTALEIARTACQNPGQLPGLTKAADHFSRVEEQPYWAKGHEPVVIIGRHAFYRLKR